MNEMNSIGMSAPRIYPVADTLLDSSLIAQTNKKIYNIKLIKCGNDYIQIYKYEDNKIKKDNNWENGTIKSKKVKTSNNRNKCKEIRKDNILRSKLALQRLIKSNIEEFKTFITLTFKDNITDIEEANKLFNIWRTRVKKEHSDFKYVCVPEYQKRGAVHFHLLTNLDLDTDIIYKQVGKNNMYDIKYWKHGFSSAFRIDNNDINIINYISKYLTKDIDNRLYGHKKYFYSKNLKMPTIEFLNENNSKDYEYINKNLEDKKLTYTSEFLNKYTNKKVIFLEYT